MVPGRALFRYRGKTSMESDYQYLIDSIGPMLGRFVSARLTDQLITAVSPVI
jgi:hypothetical protein